MAAFLLILECFAHTIHGNNNGYRDTDMERPGPAGWIIPGSDGWLSDTWED